MPLTDEDIYEMTGLTREDFDRMARPFEDGSLIDDTGSPIHFDGPIEYGPPRLYLEDRAMRTFGIPGAHAAAIDRALERLGITKSEFMQSAVRHELERVGEKIDGGESSLGAKA